MIRGDGGGGGGGGGGDDINTMIVQSWKQDLMLGGDWRGHALSHHSRHA